MFEIDRVEQRIGYEFDNINLCIQAFTRRSFSVENGGGNNEVLEFIGDKVLDTCVIRLLMEKFSSIDKDNFNLVCEYKEDKLTEMKKALVCSSYLSKRMDYLGLSDLLILGKGDIKEDIRQVDSVKEDLFEAIIGAICIDSRWNYDCLTDIISNMLDIDSFFEYGIEDKSHFQEIERWAQLNNQKLEVSFLDDESIIICNMKLMPLGINVSLRGRNEFEAKKKSSEEIYLTLKHMGYNVNKYTMEIGEPILEESLRQVNELVQKGLISKPVTEFEEKKDDLDNLLWICRIQINELNNVIVAYSSLKKDALKSASYSLLNALKLSD